MLQVSLLPSLCMYQECPLPALVEPCVAVFGTLSRSSCENVVINRVIWSPGIGELATEIDRARSRLAFSLFHSLSGRYFLQTSAHDLVMAPGTLYALGPKAAKGLKEERAGSYLFGVVLESKGGREDERPEWGLPTACGVKSLEQTGAVRSALPSVVHASSDCKASGAKDAVAANWLQSAIDMLAPKSTSRTDLAEAAEADESSAEREVLRRAIAYMEARYDGPVSIDDVARHVCLSSRHLGRLFKRATGKTTGMWLTELRLKRARWQLENGAVSSVKAVAYSCGFSSLSYFALRYRRHFGALPSEHYVGEVRR